MTPVTHFQGSRGRGFQGSRDFAGDCLVVLFVLAIALILVASGCARSKSQESGSNNKRATPVELYGVREGVIQSSLTITGTIRCLREVQIFSRISGKVTDIFVKEGDRVSKGDILITLDDRDVAAQVMQARAAVQMARARLAQAKTGSGLQSTQSNSQIEMASQGIRLASEALKQAEVSLSYARTEYERLASLFQQGAVSRQQMDQVTLQYDIAKSRREAAASQLRQAQESYALAKANTAQNLLRKEDVEVAEAALAQAAANLQYSEVQRENTRICSPIDGTVTYKNVQPGELIGAHSIMAAEGKQLLTITDNSEVYLEGEVGEEDIQWVTLGKPAVVRTDVFKGREFRGRVSTVVSAANPKSRTFRVKITVENGDYSLKSGIFARAGLVAARKKGIVLPRELVLKKDGRDYVVMMDDKGEAFFRFVKTGLKDEKSVFIEQGLKVGERIVSKGQENISEGDRLVTR